VSFLDNSTVVFDRDTSSFGIADLPVYIVDALVLFLYLYLASEDGGFDEIGG
jgi:hypothetical protein